MNEGMNECATAGRDCMGNGYMCEYQK